MKKDSKTQHVDVNAFIDSSKGIKHISLPNKRWTLSTFLLGQIDGKLSGPGKKMGQIKPIEITQLRNALAGAGSYEEKLRILFNFRKDQVLVKVSIPSIDIDLAPMQSEIHVYNKVIRDTLLEEIKKQDSAYSGLFYSFDSLKEELSQRINSSDHKTAIIKDEIKRIENYFEIDKTAPDEFLFDDSSETLYPISNEDQKVLFRYLRLGKKIDYTKHFIYWGNHIAIINAEHKIKYYEFLKTSINETEKTLKKQGPQILKEIFISDEAYAKSIEALKIVDPPIISNDNKYLLGPKQKGALTAWVQAVKQNRLIDPNISAATISKLLNKEIEGLNIGEDGTTLNRTNTTQSRLYKTKLTKLTELKS